MSTIPTFTLNNGVKIPAIGLGCWSGTTKEERAAGVSWMKTAADVGYKHFDTAQGYGTEGTLSAALKEAGVDRKDIFITTKLGWNQTTRVEESFEESLKALGTDYVDLFLVHWPFSIKYYPDNDMPKNEAGDLEVVDTPTYHDTWATMEKIYASGKAKAIGVSNFSVKTLKDLLTTAKVVPAVNQVEMHPYLSQEDLKSFCDEKGITITAYTPTGYGTVRADPVINELAKKYNVQPAQIILAWHGARGVVAVPKSSSVAHQKENLELPTLSPEDFKKVSALDKNQRLCNKENERGVVWGWTYEQLGWS